MNKKCNSCLVKYSGLLLIFLTLIIAIIMVNKFYKYK